MNALQALAIESTPTVTPADVMKTAWWMAKMIAKEYGVSAKSLFPAALKKVWSGVKVKVSLFGAYESRQRLAIIGFEFNSENKAWEKSMTLGEFKRPQPIAYGRGFITSAEIKRAFAYKHSVKFI